jgi:hypothetical protein
MNHHLSWKHVLTAMIVGVISLPVFYTTIKHGDDEAARRTRDQFSGVNGSFGRPFGQDDHR